MNPDFRDILSALSDEGVEFLLVGAYALAVHGVPRATGDIDLWIRADPENARRVWRALTRFGAPTEQLHQSDLCQPEIVFQIGVAPNRIDLITSIDGVTFQDAWTARQETELDGMRIPVISRQDLVRNKRASGRPQDLADVSRLEDES